VKRHGRRAYWGISDEQGRFDFNPIPRVYAYDLRMDGYYAIEDVPLEINGTGVERVWDDCLPPTIEIVGEYDCVGRMTPIAVEPTCELTVSNVSSYVIPGESLEVELLFWQYGEDPSETRETITLSGSLGSGVFTGECSKGALSLRWSEDDGDMWVIAFDEPTASDGLGVLPYYNELRPAVSGTTRMDPDDYYLEHLGAPFPNWGANIPPSEL
jgi:hypothetical protein